MHETDVTKATATYNLSDMLTVQHKSTRSLTSLLYAKIAGLRASVDSCKHLEIDLLSYLVWFNCLSFKFY